MKETLETIQTIFLLPYIVIRALYVIFLDIVIKSKINADDLEHRRFPYIFSGFIWLSMIFWFFYQSQFTSITYVYACPSDDNSSKCYKVRADYVPKDCEDTEWDTRGAHGGSCTGPYIDKIYFENGGYISFDYCDIESDDKWICYSADEEDGTWEIQFSEVVKVKK